MATVIPLAVLAGQAIADPAGVRIDRSWAFEREEHQWRRIPPETGASHDAQAVFTVFFPGGELAQVSGWVFRTRAGRVSLCMGCGFAVWRGTWKEDGGGALMNQGIHQVDLLQWLAGLDHSKS